MPKVEFKIASQVFELACADGEQERIRQLASSLNTRVRTLSQSFRSATDGMVIAITALMMEDEIQTLKEKLQKAINSQTVMPQPIITQPVIAANQNETIEAAVADALEPIVEAIETLAIRLERE